MNRNADSRNGLVRVMTVATAISFGCLGAIVASMKDFFGGNAAFEFSYKTILAFIGGVLVGWGFWAVFLRLIQKSDDGNS